MAFFRRLRARIGRALKATTSTQQLLAADPSPARTVSDIGMAGSSCDAECFLSPVSPEDAVNPFLQPPTVRRTEQPTEKTTRIAPTNQVVGREAFVALRVGQAQINATRIALLYGSANQENDQDYTRTGEPASGDATARTRPTQDTSTHLVTTQAVKEFHLDNAKPDVPRRHFLSGINAGVAQYYGSGNCGEHASQTFAALCAWAPPGYTITRVGANSKLRDHAFTLLWWKESDKNGNEAWCKNPVVVDAWPTNGQACLWSNHYINPANFENPSEEIKAQPFFIVAKHTVDETPETSGYDIVGKAAKTLTRKSLPFWSDQAVQDILRSMPAESSIEPLTRAQVDAIKKDVHYPLYRRTSSLGKPFGEFIDYEYHETVQVPLTAQQGGSGNPRVDAQNDTVFAFLERCGLPPSGVKMVTVPGDPGDQEVREFVASASKQEISPHEPLAFTERSDKNGIDAYRQGEERLFFTVPFPEIPEDIRRIITDGLPKMNTYKAMEKDGNIYVQACFRDSLGRDQPLAKPQQVNARVAKQVHKILTEKLRDPQRQQEETIIHRLSEFGADPSRAWLGRYENGKRSYWNQGLPPMLREARDTRAIVDPAERFTKSPWKLHYGDRPIESELTERDEHTFRHGRAIIPKGELSHATGIPIDELNNFLEKPIAIRYLQKGDFQYVEAYRNLRDSLAFAEKAPAAGEAPASKREAEMRVVDTFLTHLQKRDPEIAENIRAFLADTDRPETQPSIRDRIGQYVQDSQKLVIQDPTEEVIKVATPTPSSAGSSRTTRSRRPAIVIHPPSDSPQPERRDRPDKGKAREDLIKTVERSVGR